jgi:hypothetical protein
MRVETARYANGGESLVSHGPASVAMMMSDHFGKVDDPSAVRSACRARLRGVFAQIQMGSAPVITREICREQTVEVSRAGHDSVNQTFAPDRTNQPFDVRRLLAFSRCTEFLPPTGIRVPAGSVRGRFPRERNVGSRYPRSWANGLRFSTGAQDPHFDSIALMCVSC